MSCQSGIRYGSAEEARAARRAYLRNYRLPVNFKFCEQCDALHLNINETQLHLPKKAMIVLKLLALGYTWGEISQRTGITARTVEWYAERLRQTFGAMNVANLVAITIAHRVLDPNDFVPPLVERTHPDGHDSGPEEHLQRQAVQ